MALLAPLDMNNLLAAGLAGPIDANGTRRIHKRRLNRLSDEENAHIPFVSISSPQAEEAFVNVPDELVSLATLRYIGYAEVTASLMWQRWTNWPPGAPARETDDEFGGMPFIEFAVGPLRGNSSSLDTSDEDDQEWRICMSFCGVSSELQDAIMDPVFKRIRLTESCVFWVVDTMEMRYRGLEEIQRASREREMALQRASMCPSGPGSGSGSGGQGSSSFGPGTSLAPATTGASGGRSVSASQRLNPGIEKATAMSATALSAHNAPGYITVYKGLDQARINGLHDMNGDVVGLQTLLSSFPSDFRRAEGAYCFTAHIDIAVYYANYAKHRDSVSSVVIVQMAIPYSAIESLSETELVRTYWPSAEWKNLIFHCRNGKKLPSSLRKFKQAMLIVGTIAKKPDSVYQGLDSPDQITERMVLKTRDGRDAVQYVWSAEEGEQFLEDNGVQRLKVFPLTAKEHADWYKEESD